MHDHNTDIPDEDSMSPEQFAHMLAGTLATLQVTLDIYVPDAPNTDPNALAAYTIAGSVTATVMMAQSNVMNESSTATNELAGSSWARGFQNATEAMSRPGGEALELRVAALYARLIYQAFGHFAVVSTSPRSAAASLLLQAAHSAVIADAVTALPVDQVAQHHAFGGASVAEADADALTSARSALEALERLG